MDTIDSTVKDIKILKIQGAEAVALSSVRAMKSDIENNDFKNRDLLKEHIDSISRKLILSRPTEPFLRNCINYIGNSFHSKNDGNKDSVIVDCNFVINHIENSKRIIADIGENKIEDGMSIFTHCHSSTVLSILKLAKDKEKTFSVYNTETRPMFQGRKTAKELSDYGIDVHHMIDSAARIGLKKSDIAFIGCDAITSEGRVINKIGSELFSEIARKYDVPFYSCSNSWKLDPNSVFGFDEPIEKRNPDEVWENPPKNVSIFNPAFEVIRSDLVTGIISEIGVFTPEMFVGEVQDKYPFLFLKPKI